MITTAFIWSCPHCGASWRTRRSRRRFTCWSCRRGPCGTAGRWCGACGRYQEAFRLVRSRLAALVCRCLRTASRTMLRLGSAGCGQSRHAHHDGASHSCGGDPAHWVHTLRPRSLTRRDSGTPVCYFGTRYEPTDIKDVLRRAGAPRTGAIRRSPPAARAQLEAAGGAGSGSPAGCSTPTRTFN